MPPGKAAHHLVAALGEFELLEQRVGALVSLLRSNSEVGGVKNENLAGRQRKIQIGTLRHNSDQVLDLRLLLPHVVLADPGLAGRRPHAGGQDSDGGGFARAVWTKKAENFSRKNFQRKSVEGGNLDFGCFPPLASARAIKPPAAPNGGAEL